MPVDHHRETNRANWDARVDLHLRSDVYGIRRFIDDPDFVGEVVRFDAIKLGNVDGRRLLHLQCHIGTDTIGWARLGAEVTGIDISPKSIEASLSISESTGTRARFIVSELYDAPAALPETFDIVYTGVGAICWLPDIKGWADVVAGFLEPGGRFYMREGHPILWAVDIDREEIYSSSTTHISRQPSPSIGPRISPMPAKVRWSAQTPTTGTTGWPRLFRR